MPTIDHVTLRARDLAASYRLYSLSFELVAFRRSRHEGDGFYEWNDFSLAAVDGEHPPTRGVHVGFAAGSRPQVDDWWQALTAAGHADDGAPGPRPEYGPTYDGAFVRDPDLCVAYRDRGGLFAHDEGGYGTPGLGPGSSCANCSDRSRLATQSTPSTSDGEGNNIEAVWHNR